MSALTCSAVDRTVSSWADNFRWEASTRTAGISGATSPRPWRKRLAPTMPASGPRSPWRSSRACPRGCRWPRSAANGGSTTRPYGASPRAQSLNELLVKAVNRKSILDADKPYLHRRWNEGCHDIPQLHGELREQGFSGDIQCVRRYFRPFKKPHSPRPRQPPAPPPEPRPAPKPRRIVRWIMTTPGTSPTPTRQNSKRSGPPPTPRRRRAWTASTPTTCPRCPCPSDRQAIDQQPTSGSQSHHERTARPRFEAPA